MCLIWSVPLYFQPLTQVLHPDPLESLASLDYYGQRPWRQGHQSKSITNIIKINTEVSKNQAKLKK